MGGQKDESPKPNQEPKEPADPSDPAPVPDKKEGDE